MSEQRLIDAFGVQRQLNMSYHGCGLDGFSLGFREALGLAIQTIQNAPTMDTVKRGKWNLVTRKNIWDDLVYVFECSECKKCTTNDRGNTSKTNYCPNCGAKMDKE